MAILVCQFVSFVESASLGSLVGQKLTDVLSASHPLSAVFLFCLFVGLIQSLC